MSADTENTLPDSHFIELDNEQETLFRNWAREKYEPFTDIKPVWHPVVRDECIKINTEHASK
tara:strand:- start:452 stop:637 length:186 start_codon:yes stop_codon:yes gene_type:complete